MRSQPIASSRLRPTLGYMVPRKSKPPSGAPQWPFTRKFSLWLQDNDSTLRHFAVTHGFTPSTLHRYVREGTKLPAKALTRIVHATGLPAGYWMDDALPYPPPLEYSGLAAKVTDALQEVSLDELQEILALLRDPADRKRTLALRRAARGTPRAQ